MKITDKKEKIYVRDQKHLTTINTKKEKIHLSIIVSVVINTISSTITAKYNTLVFTINNKSDETGIKNNLFNNYDEAFKCYMELHTKYSNVK